MCRLALLPLAAAAALLPGAPAVSGAYSADFSRCNAGLERNVGVCQRFQEPGTSGYSACIRDAQIIYGHCVAEVMEQMQETPGP